MNILIVGSGGREHALAWKVSQSAKVKQVFVAPGNPGTAAEATIENVNLAVDDLDGLLAFAQAKAIDLTIVGPEVPLVLGIVDRFQAAGLSCFGPTAKAAQLEGSKTFSKDFMQRHGIPTAAYASFTDQALAMAYIKQQTVPIVVKADGLAAGKGVIVAQTEQEAIAAVASMLAGNVFGEAGKRFLDVGNVILGQAARIGTRIGQDLMFFVERLCQSQRCLGGKSETAVGFALQ